MIPGSYPSMSKLGPQMNLLYRVWAVARSFLRRLPIRLWRTVCTFFWRQIQKIRNSDPPAPRTDNSRSSGDRIVASSLALASRVPTGRIGQRQTSSSYELRESVGGLGTLQSASRALHSSSVPYFGSSSDDSSSDISFDIVPPEQPAADSGDLVHYPSEETTAAEAEGISRTHTPTDALQVVGMLPGARKSTDTMRSELSGRFFSETASHSIHSSARSYASSKMTCRDVSAQNISIIPTNSSRTSVFISPAQPENVPPSEHSSFQADSTLEVADHVYSLLPSRLSTKRYERDRKL